MRQRPSSSSSSLDMLLDTMCNTFGGVCFIALMVAIISAAIPTAKDPDAVGESVSEQMIVDKEIARLSRERNELKAAIEIQKSFISTNSTKSARSLSTLQLVSTISSNETALAKLKRQKLEYEDKLARLTTDISYSKREAMRLARLLKEMEERLGKPINTKNRAVRTPVERELGGYKSVDLWIRNGRLYCLWNERHVDCKTFEGPKGKEWDYSARPGAGFLLCEAFFQSVEYRQLIDMVQGKVYVRIFADSTSFPRLCEFRDDLIQRRKMYNWHICEEDTIHFVEGYDGRVQ